ncbi:MAG TPA: hypothetical protein VGL40_08920 [Bacillota bacterium]|jgi:hypothetical protein
MATTGNQAETYVKSLKLDAPVAREDFTKAMRGAIGDRGLMIYLIWKVLEEEHPEIDAKGLLAEACRRFGDLQAKKLGVAKTPGEWLAKASSKGGVLAWNQTFEELSHTRAAKSFDYCPHIEAAKAGGANAKEAAELCLDILMAADYGMIAPWPNFKLSFPGKTCAEGGACHMVIESK